MSMQLRFKGKNKKVHIQEFEFAAAFYAEKLMSKRLINKLSINISFDKIPKGVSGLTDPLIEYGDNPPRAFDIYIRTSMSRKNQLSTLAHEFVHVKQYARGEISCFLRGTKLKWQKDMICTEKLNYYEYPWEIEAFGREVGLYRMYIDALSQRNYELLQERERELKRG